MSEGKRTRSDWLVAWHHSLVSSLWEHDSSPPSHLPPILLLTNDYARTEEEERRWQLSCLPGGGCRETDKNTIKSSRYVYAFSFPRYNRFRRITCKNFYTVCKVMLLYNFLFLLIIINIRTLQYTVQLIKLVEAHKLNSNSKQQNKYLPSLLIIFLRLNKSN